MGAAYGAKDMARFERAVRLTSESAAFFALLCAVGIYFGGPYVIDILTPAPGRARKCPHLSLPFAPPYLWMGMTAWQLDGIFIGVTRTAAMRNAGVVAVLLYLGRPLQPRPEIWRGRRMECIFALLYCPRRHHVACVAKHQTGLTELDVPTASAMFSNPSAFTRADKSLQIFAAKDGPSNTSAE